MYKTLHQSLVSSLIFNQWMFPHAVFCAGISNESLISNYTVRVNVLKYADGYRTTVNNCKVK